MYAESHYDDVEVSCLQKKIRTLQAWAVSTTITARCYSQGFFVRLALLRLVDASYREYRFSVMWHCVYRVTSATSPTVYIMNIAPSTIKL